MKHVKILTLGLGAMTLVSLVVYLAIEAAVAFPWVVTVFGTLLLFTMIGYLLGEDIVDHMKETK